jgi:hypothetical protein
MTFAAGERVLYTRVEKNGRPAEPWRVEGRQKKSNLSPTFYQLSDGHNRLFGVWEDDLIADSDDARLASRQRAAVCVVQAMVTRTWRQARLRKLISQQARLEALAKKIPESRGGWSSRALRAALVACTANLSSQIAQLATIERWVDPETSARLSRDEAWLFKLEHLRARYRSQMSR